MTKETGHHSFDVEEATRLGSIEKALILKEIRQMSIYRIRRNKPSHVYYSSAALAEKFPYMSPKSIWRWMNELEEAKEIVSVVENKFRYDRTKSYTTPELLISPRESAPQNGESDAPEWGDDTSSIPSLSEKKPPSQNEIKRGNPIKPPPPHTIGNIDDNGEVRDKAGNKVGGRAEPDRKPVPQIVRDMAEVFIKQAGLVSLDGGTKDGEEVLALFKTKSVAIDQPTTDEGILENFGYFIKRATEDRWHGKNMTSFSYVLRNFNKICKSLDL